MLKRRFDDGDYTKEVQKSVDTYFSWPSRVSFDFGKHQITNIEWVLFTHFARRVFFYYFSHN